MAPRRWATRVQIVLSVLAMHGAILATSQRYGFSHRAVPASSYFPQIISGGGGGFASGNAPAVPTVAAAAPGEEFHHTWRIPEFLRLRHRTGQRLTSDIFSVPSTYGAVRMYVTMYPRGYTNPDYLSAFLHVDHMPPAANSINVAFQISLEADDGTVIKADEGLQQGLVHKFTRDAPNWGYPEYVTRTHASDSLHDHEGLIFGITVAVIDGTALIPQSTISVVSQNTVNWRISSFRGILSPSVVGGYRSRVFSLPAVGGARWRLVLVPGGHTLASPRHMSLVAELVGVDGVLPLSVHLTFSVLAARTGLHSYTQSTSFTYTRTNQNWGFLTFVSNRNVQEPRNGLLAHDGSITFTATITLPPATTPSPLSTVECGRTLITNRGPPPPGQDYSGCRQKRVLSGAEVTPGSHPYMAGIWTRDTTRNSTRFRCGASILSEFWLVTSAHCVAQNALVTLFLGELTYSVKVGDHHQQCPDLMETEFAVEDTISHPKYVLSRRGPLNDIALIRIKPGNDGRGIHFNSYVQPICLPSAADVKSLHFLVCDITGWGKTSDGSGRVSEVLRSARVTTMPHQTCNAYHPELIVTDTMICGTSPVYGQPADTCDGDSGGPLACHMNGKSTLVGVTSFGEGCGRDQRPGVYTSVIKYTQWIEDTIRSAAGGGQNNYG